MNQSIHINTELSIASVYLFPNMMARRNVNNLTCKTVEFTDSLFKQVPSLLNGIIYEGEYGNAVLNLHKVIFSWMMGSYFNVILCGTLGK